MSDIEKVKTGLLGIITSIEGLSSQATQLSDAYQQAVATFNSLMTGSQKPEVDEAREVIAAAAQFVFYAEGKSEEVRYAIECVVRGL